MQATLNPEQWLGVTYTDGPVMILAGAGTGKTRVITQRIAHLLAQGMPPREIVALTFTNKAAREMHERLGSIVGKVADAVFCGTFHSYCLFLLRKYYRQAGLERSFGLIGTADQLDLIKKSLEHEGWAGLYRPEELLTRISRAKNALLTSADLRNGSFTAAQYSDPDPDLIARVYGLYERQLTLNRVIDFDDCILKVALLFAKNLDIKTEVRASVSQLLVDEFQDTNFAQLNIIEAVAGGHKQICVVGDDDQSIYSWRGAMVETMLRFEEIFHPVHIIKLEQNYRCSNVILNAANQLIRQNTQRKDKTLWSASEVSEPLILATFDDESAEARWIASKCYGFLGQGLAPSDMAVLFRTNGQGRALEEAFREQQLAYQIVGGTSFFERKEVRDFLAYLRLIASDDDRLAFFRIINTPSRGIGLKTLEQIDALTQSAGCSPFSVLERGLLKTKGQTPAEIATFIQKIKVLQALPLETAQNIEDLGRAMLKEFGLDQEILTKVSDYKQRTWKLELLNRLPQWLAKLAQNSLREKAKFDLKVILDRLTLSDDRDRHDERTAKTPLMTIHAAKGLEWPIVFVCGVEEELLPHKNSLDIPLSLSEERRLMYVAMTRAKRHLHISHCRERAVGFQRQERKPSRFLAEIPTDGVQRQEPESEFMPKESRKEHNLQRLTDLKAQLKGGFGR